MATSVRSGWRRLRSNSVYVGATILVVALLLGAAYFETAARPNNDNEKLAFLSPSPNYPVLGSGSAPFTIFEFSDFQCPNCCAWFKAQEPSLVQNLIDNGKAKLVWRDFVIYGSDSRLAASAAYSAGEQGKFWEFHDLLLANQGQADSGWVTQQSMIGFAQKLGLNLTQFTQSMNSGKYGWLIDLNFKAGEELGVWSIPTFFVVGPSDKYVVIPGTQPESVFQQAISGLSGG